MKVVFFDSKRMANGLATLLIMTFLSLGSLTAMGQDNTELAFVADESEFVMTARPAQIMTSPIYRKLGRPMERILKRLTDEYFKLSLVELKDIEHITVARSFPQPGANGYTPGYDAMIIRSRDDNEQGFDMVTQNVSSVHKLSNKEYFEFTRPLSQQYRFAYIADSKTIVWTATAEAMEASIRSGKSGPASTPWTKEWNQNRKGHFTAAGKLSSFMQQQIPPNFSAAKKLNYVILSGKLGEQSLVKLFGKTASAADAKEVTGLARQMIEMGKSGLKMQSQVRKSNEDKAALKFLEQMINSVRVNQSQQNVEVTANSRSMLKRYQECWSLFRQRPNGPMRQTMSVKSPWHFTISSRHGGTFLIRDDSSGDWEKIQLANCHSSVH